MYLYIVFANTVEIPTHTPITVVVVIYIAAVIRGWIKVGPRIRTGSRSTAPLQNFVLLLHHEYSLMFQFRFEFEYLLSQEGTLFLKGVAGLPLFLKLCYQQSCITS